MANMKAIQIKSYVKSLDDLTVDSDIPAPTPKSSEYLIRIHASATNFFDILQVQGRYQHQPPFPWISGSEFSGIVLRAPTDGSCTRFNPGDKVFGAAQGSFAEIIACPGESLLPVPQGWSFEEAAGLHVTAPTSYGALVTRAGIKKDEWVLVHAAAGGVSLAAIQIAKAFGATVIATASTSAKLTIAASFGADHLVDYSDTTTPWTDKVSQILKANSREGVDIVFDPVGLINPSLKVAAWNCRLLVIGFAGGEIEKVAVNRVLLKNVSVVGIHWGMYRKFEPRTVPQVWDGIFDLIEQGKFRPTVYRDRQYVGLDSVKLALKALGGRETWGKVVIKIPGEEELARL